MNRYSDLFYQVKSNSKKIESIDKIKREHTFYNNETKKYRKNYPHQQADVESNESFSIRMIAVMLLLVVVMFLKQTGVFDENMAYESMMAEIHRQITAEEVESIVMDDTVYPVLNWISGESYR
ncbi:MAG: hypothetical protein ACI4BB_06670 [Coprococcus sp.]